MSDEKKTAASDDDHILVSRVLPNLDGETAASDVDIEPLGVLLKQGQDVVRWYIEGNLR